MDKFEGICVELVVVIQELKGNFEEITPDQVPSIVKVASGKDLKKLEV